MKERIATLNDIKILIGISYDGTNLEINGLNLCNRQTIYPSIVSYTTSSSFFSEINRNESIKALFITPALLEQFIHEYPGRKMSYFIVNNPETEFYKLHEKLWEQTVFYNKFTFEPKIGRSCNIHSSAVIENGVIIRDNVIIGPSSVIRKGSIIENNVRIGCCSVIGSEGFQGIRYNDGSSHVITHVGGTHLMQSVYIGDNTTVGNALFEGMCIVGKNTKVDNHVHIAHNCLIGDNNIITASSLLMGSSILENNTWLAPNVVVMNKKIIHNNSFVGSMSLVTKDVPENTTVVGIPAKKWK